MNLDGSTFFCPKIEIVSTETGTTHPSGLEKKRQGFSPTFFETSHVNIAEFDESFDDQLLCLICFILFFLSVNGRYLPWIRPYMVQQLQQLYFFGPEMSIQWDVALQPCVPQKAWLKPSCLRFAFYQRGAAQ